MQRFRPIETLVPQKAASYGEPIRRVAAMAKDGLPVPPGFALSREHTDALYAASGLDKLVSLLDVSDRDELAAQAAERKRIWLARPLDATTRDALRRIQGRLEGVGARAWTLSVVLVCDRLECERSIGGTRLGIDTHAAFVRSVHEGMAALFEPELLQELQARGVRDAGVALLIQRMVDGLVSGVVFTRHPVTGDAREWLLRSGYGLAGKVLRGEVQSDVLRVTRDGFVRDQVIAKKATRYVAQPDGSQALRDVPDGLRDRAALSDALMPDVLRLASRVERHLGAPVSVEWALHEGRVHLLDASLLPSHRKLSRERSNDRRSRALWSHQELGEALPHVLSPLTWSLLRRFSRVGLAGALQAGGAAFASDENDLIVDVRGRVYLNLSAITDAVCRLPGVTPHALKALGIEIGETSDVEGSGVLALARSAFRLLDTQVRFVRHLPWVAERVSRERAHFAGLDTRLLSPEAVERVLCDVETWLRDAGLSLMRCYGLWVTALVALRAIFVRYHGNEALRLERDLFWGPAEVLPSQSAGSMLTIARSLSRDSRAVAWAEGEGDAPDFVREALLDLTLKHRYEGLSWLDPASARFYETSEQLLGVLRALLSDPMALAVAADRAALVHGRRERAEREWKRRVPMALWPITGVLINRLRALTKQREELLIDAARAVTVLREITLDASRRLAMREPALGREAAFLLDLNELHGMLAGGVWGVHSRVVQRRVELGVVAELPASPQRFVGRPFGSTTFDDVLAGACGSGGAAEGKVVRIVDGSELATLPRGAVLVVRACDVGLAPVLPAVRAVIAECGGMLSHGVMLASALGVPVVVGVEQALLRFENGERVRVDGDHACVERIGTRPS